MEETTTAQINAYKSAVDDFDDFIDFLYSEKRLNEDDYFNVWHKKGTDRISELFNIIHSQQNLEQVLVYLKHTYPNHETNLKEQRDFRISSVRGGFPELPPNYVSRRDLVKDVKHKLQDLLWNQKLVIHGMMGYGKSCLINDVLRDNDVRKYFDNFIFWINLGDCHIKEDAWQPMLRLYNTASSFLDKKISHCPDDLDTLKKSLEDLFLTERLKNAVIILDDVCNSTILSLFDIRCKTVITTQNKKIFDQRTTNIFVEVKTGFSLMESLELFKQSLKSTGDLPSAADEIHTICQGHPMLISLIGSFLYENAEEVRTGNNEIWGYMKKLFLEGNYRLNEYDSEGVDINQIVKNCIEKLLTDNLKDLYHALAIFEQDVNIPPEVLKILWNRNYFEVKNIMNILAEKSLIVPFYHNDLKTYIYGIHEIYRNYLRNIASANLKYLHKRLLAGYDRITERNYARLPNDNYTLQFIGYHIFEAEEFDKFQIYFDLKFLELKLKAVGKGDVLRDMHKYEKYITRGENNLIEKLNQYKDFIQRCGSNLYSYEKTDIIQYALRENRDSFVFRDAFDFAKQSSHLYFQLQKPCEELDYSQIIMIKDDITCACFVDSPQNILIGTTNGKIKLFFEQSVKEISSFIGHDGAITNLIVSTDRRYFLSVSIDGTVMLWKFAADSSRNSYDLTNGFLKSPKTKQSFWQDMHTPDRGTVLPHKRFKLKDDNGDDFLISAAFCSNFPDTFRIATGSNEGNVVIWEAHDETPLYRTGKRGIPASCLLYIENEDGEHVLFSCQDAIYKYDVINGELKYHSIFYNSENCKSIFLNRDALLVVSSENVTQWAYNKKTVLLQTNFEDKMNVCSTLTNDNQYLVVSTNQKTVYIWDIQQKKVLREFENKGLAKSLDSFYDENKSVHILLIGSDKKTLQQCHLHPYEQEPRVENMPVFIPHWKKKNALIALASKDDRLQVFSSCIIISESEVAESQITCTCFSVCGNTVIYGLRNGRIGKFDIRTRNDVTLQEPNDSPVTFLECFDLGNQYCRPSNNSRGSSDSLDFLETFLGIVVATFGTDQVSVYHDTKILTRKIRSPTILHCSQVLLVVTCQCKMFTWDIKTDTCLSITNSHILEPVTLGVGCYCPFKSLVGMFYVQNESNTSFFDIYVLDKDGAKVEMNRRLVMYSEKVRTAQFSGDGALLAMGLESGAIKLFNLNDDYKSISLNLHEDSIQHLIFAPHTEPILISLGEEIAWWTLRLFQENIGKKTENTRKDQRETFKKGRTLSLDFLESLHKDLNYMNINYWSTRETVSGSEYLLSVIKLKAKAKYISASNDFNSFLCIDRTGKIYNMEIIANPVPGE